MPNFQITLPDGTEYVFELTEETVTVGRLADNSLVLDDASVSSHHAELVLNDGDYILRDIGSTNGTKFNGQRVTANDDHALHNGAIVFFGQIRAAYVSEFAGEGAPMPEVDQPVMAAAASSVQPADFVNASPFQNKGKQKAGSGTGVMVLGIVAILASFGAIAAAVMMKAP